MFVHRFFALRSSLWVTYLFNTPFPRYVVRGTFQYLGNLAFNIKEWIQRPRNDRWNIIFKRLLITLTSQINFLECFALLSSRYILAKNCLENAETRRKKAKAILSLSTKILRSLTIFHFISFARVFKHSCHHYVCEALRDSTLIFQLFSIITGYVHTVL